MTDQLSPEDRALYDAFFAAYKVKFDEIRAGDPQASLDVCTVHAIKAMVDRACSDWSEAWEDVVEDLADDLGELQSLPAIKFPEAFVSASGRNLFGCAAKVLRVLVNFGADTPAPRIVSAVGVGVRVKPPEGGE